jgi:hypothetical protein
LNLSGWRVTAATPERGRRRKLPAIIYSSFMSENRRELTTTVGIVGIAKTVAPQWLAITDENYRKRPAA